MYNLSTLNEMAGGKRVPCSLFFNKLNGMFLHASSLVNLEEISNQEYVTIVTADFDLINDKVVGCYPDYKVMDRLEGPQTFYEAQADAAMSTKITKKYPVVEQVNVLGRAIAALAAATGTEMTELTEMLEYIKLCKDINANTKEFYSESPDFIYVSNAELAETDAARTEGGLHELYGPRTITGGRVFSTDS